MTYHDHIEEPSNEELRTLTRRSALRLMGGAGLALLAGCAAESSTASTTTSATAATAATGTTTAVTAADFGGDGACVLIPEETEGPYPLDLSSDETFFRSQINEDKVGVPLTIELTLLDVPAGCTPVSGARVDVWHCDAEGVYSGYSQPGADTTGETFCRGIQVTDDSGVVAFQTVYPGWYTGRITHVHFEVFLENGLAATSQIAFPAEVTDTVYAVDPYAAKGPNTSVTSFAADNVFSDGTQYQLATLSGDPASGYTATLVVGIEA